MLQLLKTDQYFEDESITLTIYDCLIELARIWAEVAELADALRSGRSEHYAREGSNPSSGTH
jgi:hypothetical protein